MRTVVPFSANDPKTRLGPVLDAAERTAFAANMLADVVEAIREAGGRPTVLADGPTSPLPVTVEAPVVVDDRPLTEAVNGYLADRGVPMAIVVGDVPLIGPATIERLYETSGAVVLAPGLGGGTNAILTRRSDFRVDYHGGSIRKHRRTVEALGERPAVLDSFRLALDVDEPADLAEVLLHGTGRAATWLREAGFALETDDGRLRVTRAG